MATWPAKDDYLNGEVLTAVQMNDIGDELNELYASSGASPLTTKGDLYTYTTEDARIGVGADGTILTADSAEATGMKWAAASGGGGITLITSTDMAGAATFTFSSIVATYKDLVVIVKNQYQAADAKLKIEFNSDNTATNYEFTMTSGRSSGPFTGYNNSNFLQEFTTEGADADNFMYLYIPDYTNTIARKQIQNHAGFLSDNGGITTHYGTHQWRNTSAISQILIASNSGGNFTTGTVELYGVN